jgi:8-oxo-dGTP pyrophosphatase MutT (NUDIX family)
VIHEKIKNALASKIDLNILDDDQNRLASVLIIIYGDKPEILMTKKPITMTQHGGEISFPGGKMSESDLDLLDTVIRETKEETGLSISKNDIIGQLHEVKTLNSRFTILPFICILDKVGELIPNSEVELFLHIPLLDLLNTLENDLDPKHNSIQEMYTYTFEKNLIWGASARMLKQITDVLKEENILK